MADYFLADFFFALMSDSSSASSVRVQIPAVQQTLHHRRERAVEGVLERVKQFAALRLRARDGGLVNGQFAFLFRLEHALDDHAVHQRADGRIMSSPSV